MSVIIIGAGVAGLAAAHTLRTSDHTVTVLEARQRIGGRVYTRRDIAGAIPVEMGAEFIHGDQAPTWEIVHHLGLRTLHWEKQTDSLVRMETGELVTMADARQNPAFDITRTWDLPDLPVHPQDEDLHHYLTRHGFTPEQLQYTRRSFVNAHGESIDHISAAAALADMQDDTAGEGDYRLLDGYDQLVRHLARNQTIHMNTVVEKIVWGADGVRVMTDHGRLYEADHVIVTVPVGVLLAGDVTFEPELPQAKQAALGQLQMGPGLKLVYVFDRPLLPDGVMALYSSRTPSMWWSPSVGHPDAPAFVITAFATGDYARELIALGEREMQAQGVATLREELGAAAVPDPTAVFVQNWATDPYTKGVYSSVMTGGGDCRAVLARPLAGRLHFAGEATASNAWAATVHGAYASGLRAASEVVSPAG